MKKSSIVLSFLSTLIGVGFLLALTGCATQGHAPSALCSLTDDNGKPIPATFTGTLNPRHQGHAATHVVLVQKAETACCNGFDRIVFTCEGFHHPTWKVRYVHPPIKQCASGNNIGVTGNAFLQISMDTAEAHTDAGQPTITDRDRHLNCPNLKQLVLTCDFEAKVGFVFGLNAKKPYRVVELENPTRLVIDVKN
ncbi:MAG TPA: hypothetical protein VF899_12300 [Pyrinomonadaceae bacterium]